MIKALDAMKEMLHARDGCLFFAAVSTGFTIPQLNIYNCTVHPCYRLCFLKLNMYRVIFWSWEALILEQRFIAPICDWSQMKRIRLADILERSYTVVRFQTTSALKKAGRAFLNLKISTEITRNVTWPVVRGKIIDTNFQSFWTGFHGLASIVFIIIYGP